MRARYSSISSKRKIEILIGRTQSDKRPRFPSDLAGRSIVNLGSSYCKGGGGVGGGVGRDVVDIIEGKRGDGEGKRSSGNSDGDSDGEGRKDGDIGDIEGGQGV